MNHELELSVALEAAEAAGELVREEYERFAAIPDAPSDISTEADRASQELILQTILRRFPNDALVAEERTPTLESARHSGSRLWIVDPIDGTRGFAVKNGEFSVMIAFVHDGQIEIGVVLEPATGRTTFATRDGGCWRDQGKGGAKTQCRVGTAADLGSATLIQSRSRTAKESPVVSQIKPARIVESFSSGVKLARLACGEADLYANIYPQFNDWDICRRPNPRRGGRRQGDDARRRPNCLWSRGEQTARRLAREQWLDPRCGDRQTQGFLKSVCCEVLPCSSPSRTCAICAWVDPGDNC